MRIVYISKFIQNKTGTARSLIDTVKFLDRTLFCPICLLPKKSKLSEELKEYGVETFFLEQVTLTKNMLMPFIINVLKFIKIYKSINADLIHVQQAGYRKSYVLAAKLLRLPIIIHLRNPYKKGRKQLTLLNDFSPFLASKIASNSLNNAFPFSMDKRFKNKTEVIYNGIDFEKFEKAKTKREEFTEKNKDMILIGTVGQVSKRKGIKDFIKMISIIIKKERNIKFIIIGSDAPQEPGYTKKMKKHAISLNVENYLSFTGYRTDIPSLMKTLDIFVLASHSEPFGRVIVEAMAAGTPVVSTKVGGIPEIIKNEDLGLLVKKEDPLALSKAVLKYIYNVQLRIDTGERAKEYAKKYFSVEIMIDSLTKLYVQLKKF